MMGYTSTKLLEAARRYAKLAEQGVAPDVLVVAMDELAVEAIAFTRQVDKREADREKAIEKAAYESAMAGLHARTEGRNKHSRFLRREGRLPRELGRREPED